MLDQRPGRPSDGLRPAATVVLIISIVAGIAVIGAVESSTCSHTGIVGAIRERLAGSAASAELGDVGDDPNFRVCGPPDRVIEFAGTAGASLNPAEWNHETGGNGWGNKELQTYTDAASNSAVDGHGNLLITARREKETGADGITRGYTSARVSTQHKVEVPPGSYVEASIRAPVGQGVWPAFWLIGADIDSVGWPASGELDVLEAYGANPTVATSRIHLASRDDPRVDMPVGDGSTDASYDFGHALDTRAHRFGVYFDADRVQFYVDRQKRLTYTAEQAAASGRDWPFADPQFIVLNIAIGGIAKDPDGTRFPREMTVSPISIWHAAGSG